ncbi:MAG TPA: patatin-like phospholipase family protein [Mycobacteriales bacterium]|nr:patatin-like phospholipase family protein [Mycobacteriales bacterium]
MRLHLRGPRRAPADAGPRFETAIVLSGGGSHGAAQAGMLLGLLEAGVRPDLIVGVSVGALHAAAIASDPSVEKARGLTALWETLTARDVFGPPHRHALMNLLRHADHLYEPAALRALVHRCLPPGADLGDLAVPVQIATTDLDAGRLAWWGAGPAADVLVASAALPGLLPPVTLHDAEGTPSRHVDGGVLAPVPVQRALELGAKDVWLLDVTGGAAAARWPGGEQLTAAQVLLRSFTVARYAGLPESWDALAAPGQRVHVVEAPAVSAVDIRDFSHGKRLVAAGFAAMRAVTAGVAAA